MWNTEMGRWGEARAKHHLLAQGYVILAENWSCAEGEVDLIAQEGETIVFTEVKTRSSHRFGRPEEGVTKGKKRRLQRAAWRYLQENGIEHVDWRIDVIAIDRDEHGRVARLDHYRNAVMDQGEAL
jgi:putative endonuclease